MPETSRPDGRPPSARRPSEAGEVSSTGFNPRRLAVFCYAAGWLSGAAFLLVERRSPSVRFHAWQAVLGLGGLFALGLGSWLFTLLMAFVATSLFNVFAVVTQAVWGFGLIVWGLVIIQTARGRVWRLPLVGSRAERLAARPVA